MEKKEFEFEGKKYEIRSWLLDGSSTYRVKVFLDNKPANGYHYDIELEMVHDAKRDKFPRDLLDEQIKLAENDIKEKKWENLLK